MIEPGFVMAYAGGHVPPGWVECDGRSLDRRDPRYRDLFTAIGTIHGGDGNPLFQVPDYRGMFLRGVSEQSGRDPDADARTSPGIGNTGNGGNRIGSIQRHAFETHRHQTAARFLEAEGGTDFFGAGFDSNSNPTVPRGPYQTSSAIDGNQSTETRPINAYVNYVIKL